MLVNRTFVVVVFVRLQMKEHGFIQFADPVNLTIPPRVGWLLRIMGGNCLRTLVRGHHPPPMCCQWTRHSPWYNVTLFTRFFACCCFDFHTTWLNILHWGNYRTSQLCQWHRSVWVPCWCREVFGVVLTYQKFSNQLSCYQRCCDAIFTTQ